MNAVTAPAKMVQHPLELISDDVPLEVRMPRNMTELRAALSNVRGEKKEAVRFVMVRSNATNSKGRESREVEIHGPKDGRPLIVEVTSGMAYLKVMSGRVLIWADSHWGNSIETFNQSEVDIVVAPDRKATITAHHESKVTIHKGEGSWGLQRAVDSAELSYAS